MEVLRVPLHAHTEAGGRDLGGFDDAVGGDGGDDEAAARRTHGLVMPAVHCADAVGPDEPGEV